MSDILKKGLLVGLGAVALGEEKVRELADELIKRGELKKEVGGKFVEEFLKKTAASRKAVEDVLADATAKALQKLQIPTRKEWKALEARVKKLEKKRK